jgi:hypothetical protein
LDGPLGCLVLILTQGGSDGFDIGRVDMVQHVLDLGRLTLLHLLRGFPLKCLFSSHDSLSRTNDI